MKIIYKIFLILLISYSCASRKVVTFKEQNIYKKVSNAARMCKFNEAIKMLKKSGLETLTFFIDESDESSYFGKYSTARAIELIRDIAVTPYLHCEHFPLTVDGAKKRYECIRKVPFSINSRRILQEKYGRKGHLPFFRFGGIDINDCKVGIIKKSESDIERIRLEKRQARYKKIKKLRNENPVFAKCLGIRELKEIEANIKKSENQIIYIAAYGTADLRKNLPLIRQNRDYQNRLLRQKKVELRQWNSVQVNKSICDKWNLFY